jgi:hypothetical protein
VPTDEIARVRFGIANPGLFLGSLSLSREHSRALTNFSNRPLATVLECQGSLVAIEIEAGIRSDKPSKWRHFVELMEALPADQAAPLWQAVQAQAMRALEVS